MVTRIVGLDIGNQVLRGIELEYVAKKRPVVRRYHEIALPEGAVRNGEVIEENTVATALKQLWAEAKFRSRDVVIGLGNQKVLARDLVVPRGSIESIRAALPFQVQDLIPVPVTEALLDFYPISEISSDTGPAVSGLLVAAVKTSVLANVNAIRKAGLSPVDVDLVPFALQRSIGADTVGTAAVIDIGATTTNIVISTGGVPQFVRIIPAGGDDLTRALISRLGIDRELAERVKAGIGLANGSVPPENRAAVEVIYEVTRELLNSLRNTLSYFASTRGGRHVEQVVLSGGAARLPGFAESLASMTSMTVTMADPFAKVQLGKDAKHLAGSPTRAAVALGLVLGRAA